MARRRWMSVGLLAVSCVSTSSPAPESKPRAASEYRPEIEHLRRPVALGSRWSWPRETRFLDVWNERERATTHHFLVAQYRAQGSSPFTIYATARIASEAWSIEAIARDGGGRPPRFNAGCHPVGESKTTLSCDGAELEIEWQAAARPVRPREWFERVYAQTLLNFEGSAYEDPLDPPAPDSSDGSEELGQPWPDFERASSRGVAGLESARLALRRALQTDAVQSVGRAIRYLESQAPSDPLLRRLYARYRPVGGCSRDVRPQAAAARYAKYCARTHRTGCFLQLHSQLAANRFQRVASTPQTERAAHPVSKPLAEMGIDHERWLWDFDAPSSATLLQSTRWARTVHQAGLAVSLRPQLIERVQDSQLDPYNRFEATLALIELERRRADDTRRPVHEVRESIMNLDLERSARRFVASL